MLNWHGWQCPREERSHYLYTFVTVAYFSSCSNFGKFMQIGKISIFLLFPTKVHDTAVKTMLPFALLPCYPGVIIKKNIED